MYFLIDSDNVGNIEFRRFPLIQELSDYIKESTSNEEEMLIDELGRMVVLEGREYKASLLELKYEKHIKLEAKE